MQNHIHTDETDEDRVKISISNNGIERGYIVIDRVFNGPLEFQEYMTDDEYYDIFLSDDFYKIEHIESHYKGTGSVLMKLAIDYIKSKRGISIYLNACPVKHKSLDVTQLVRFYSKFGFKIMEATDLWDNNKEMVLLVAS